MKILVLGKINNYLILLNNENLNNCLSLNATDGYIFVHKKAFENLNNSIIERTYLKNHINISLTYNKYKVIEDDTYILLKGVTRFETIFGSKYNSNKLFAENIVSKFREKSKNKLIESLFHNDRTLDDCLKAVCNYVFCEHISFWVFNKETDVFTKEYSSFITEKDYIYKNEERSLNDCLNDNYSGESRPLKDDQLNNAVLKSEGIIWISRLKVKLTSENIIGIITFYSKREKHNIKEKTRKLIHGYITDKYLSYEQSFSSKLEDTRTFIIENYNAGNLSSLLFNIVCEIRSVFGYEACSIFLLEGKLLTLAATSDLLHNGEPSEYHGYDIDKEALTTIAFNGKSETVITSYNVNKDPRNSKQYNEKTKNTSTNWMGIALTCKGRPIGVIRVKNKLNTSGNVIPLQPTDTIFFKMLSLQLSSIIEIEDTHLEITKRAIEAEDMMSSIKDFNDVMLHEVRSPIGNFTLAYKRIQIELDRLKVDIDKFQTVIRRVKDIQIFGSRLKFITDLYYIDRLFQKREQVRLSVLEDIVIPVTNISKDFFKRNYNIDLEYDYPSLSGKHVLGDQILMSIVFNALVDNAGKYTPKGERRPIFIWGEETNNKEYLIHIDNYGFEIFESEIQKLFDRNERGEVAKKIQREGTGIGLFLAKKIMLNNDGDVVNSKLSNPVRFTIKCKVVT